jgi:6-phosphogluconolactonase
MTNQNIQIYPDTETLVRAAAEHIASMLEEMLRRQETVTLAMTGGKTPEPVYALLASPPYLQRVDWNRVHFLWGDERCVPPDHPDSNFGMAWKALFSKLDVPSGNIHRMKGELADPAESARLYENEIRTLLPGPAVSSLDLVLLGMGPDGHVASLFPGTQWDEDRLVVPNYVPQTGAGRISMTPRILNEAQAVLFIVSGGGKAKALADVLQNPSTDLPASRIHPAKGSLTWMVDDSAASLLKTGE